MRLIKAKSEFWTAEHPLDLIERAGRVCYQSEPQGDPEGFVRGIIRRGHESVIEHAWFAVKGFTYRPNVPFMVWEDEHQLLLGNARAWRNAVKSGQIGLPLGMKEYCPVLWEDVPQKAQPGTQIVSLPEGCVFTANFIIPRGLSHELVRHRHDISFSQESTRYCDYSGGVGFIIPPWVDLYPGDCSGNDLMDLKTAWHNESPGPKQDQRLRTWLWAAHMYYCECAYGRMRQEGWTPQQARGCLPIDLKTQIVTTAHWSEWQIIFALRTDMVAHPQMREVMVPLHEELAVLYPDKFAQAVIEAVRAKILNRRN